MRYQLTANERKGGYDKNLTEPQGGDEVSFMGTEQKSPLPLPRSGHKYCLVNKNVLLKVVRIEIKMKIGTN